MAADREARISLRAYQIWEREGRPFGEHDQHWEQARREIEAEEEAWKISPLERLPAERSKSEGQL